MNSFLSHIIAFVSGILIVIIGNYYSKKYTDKRYKKEADKIIHSKLIKIRDGMPELIDEMKDDLKNDSSVREFCVSSKNHALGAQSKKRFIYYEEDHDNLISKIDILENNGFITNVSPKNLPIYRMTEEFVGLIINY